MSTTIRPEVSKNNKYWISKKHYHELKNFCLQYDEWKKAMIFLNPDRGVLKCDKISPTASMSSTSPTEWLASRRLYFSSKIDLVDEMAILTDSIIGEYVKMGVTKGMSYDALRIKYGVPCCREKYYELYRRFFWLLARER